MIYVTRRESFSASHRLHSDKLSDEENERLFGKCNNYHGHGHNYILEVKVAGEINPITGYVIDLKKLKQIIQEHVISKLDHKHLNYDVEFLQGLVPTAESIAIGIWNILKEKIHEGELYSVKLYETENNIVEYKGE